MKRNKSKEENKIGMKKWWPKVLTTSPKKGSKLVMQKAKSFKQNSKINELANDSYSDKNKANLLENLKNKRPSTNRIDSV